MNVEIEFYKADFDKEHFARFAENIYDSSLIEQNKQVDNILKLLLGSQFKRPISELELIEKYHYPTVTDKEVHDAAMRNL